MEFGIFADSSSFGNHVFCKRKCKDMVLFGGIFALECIGLKEIPCANDITIQIHKGNQANIKTTKKGKIRCAAR